MNFERLDVRRMLGMTGFLLSVLFILMILGH
jgi:hypothetical protein